MLRGLPAQLLGDLVSEGLGAVAVERTQVDINQAPAILSGDFRAEAVYFVIIPLHRQHIRAIDERADDFALFEIMRNEDV